MDYRPGPTAMQRLNEYERLWWQHDQMAIIQKRDSNLQDRIEQARSMLIEDGTLDIVFEYNFLLDRKVPIVVKHEV